VVLVEPVVGPEDGGRQRCDSGDAWQWLARVDEYLGYTRWWP
jgi:hypothetical protein